MNVLDQIMNLRQRGASDRDIVRALQEQGVSPLQINDALGRAQIKSAVSSGMGIEQGMEHSILSSEEEPERLPLEGLEGGTLSDIELTPPSPGGFVPMPRNVTKEIQNGGDEMYNQQGQQENMAYYQPQQYTQYQDMPQEAYQYSPMLGNQAIDTDTMIEVSEQVFMEKNKPLQKKIDDIDEFRAISQTRLDHISERLKKIESIIDNLQAAILEKVGGYGHGLETMKKEMNMMQDSFGKIVGEISEKSEERHYHEHHHPQSQSHTPHISHPQHHNITVHKSKKITTRKHYRKSSKK